MGGNNYLRGSHRRIGYDYLAYVSYLRDKAWGQAGRATASAAELQTMAADPAHLNRRWLRAVAVDSTLSFLAVLIFSGVFVACGAMILGPQQQNSRRRKPARPPG